MKDIVQFVETDGVLARGESMQIPPLLAERKSESEVRLDALRQAIGGCVSTDEVPNLAIFCAGSFARLDASKHSDIDLFFVSQDSGGISGVSRLREIQLFADIIGISRGLSFPEFSNDGQYLQTHSTEHILEHMGSPADDWKNLFTLRMLMLLESRCVFNEAVLQDVQREVIESYFRDEHGHEADFKPWFLLNDVTRYWKTLLLNYEHRRNQPAEEDEQRIEQKVRNFKLKYSRMTTCHATIAALASMPETVTRDDVFNLAQLTPHERLQIVVENRPDVRAIVERILDDYSWFMEKTGLSKEELHDLFRDSSSTAIMFDRARDYGRIVFELLLHLDMVDGRIPLDGFLRHLVV